MRILIFDGNFCAHRAYHTTGQTLSNGTFYGIIKITNNVVKKLKPDKTIFVFDNGRSIKKTTIYPAYKQNRKGNDSFLYSQISIAQDALRSLGIDVLSVKHFEGDDLVGIISNHLKDKNDVIIVSSDADFLQLLDKNRVMIYNPLNDEMINEEKFMLEHNGLMPKNIIDIKAISGDSSDNIDGIEGIGKKGAIKAMKIIGSINNLPNGSLTGKFEKMNLPESIKIIQRNISLVTIPTSMKDVESTQVNDVQSCIDSLFKQTMDFDKFMSLTSNFKSLNMDEIKSNFSHDTEQWGEMW